MGPVCLACGGTGQIGEQACTKCDGVGRPEERPPQETEKEAQETDAETVGPTHLAETPLSGEAEKQICGDAGSGNDAVPGIPRDSAPSVGEGTGLPSCHGQQGLPDVGSGDGGDHGASEVQEWKVVVPSQRCAILESEEFVDWSPYVTRAQANRIVTLISQGWDPDTIFERVGVAIV